MGFRQFFGFLAIVSFLSPVYAQQANPFGVQAPLGAGSNRRSMILDSQRAVRVIYGNSAWNRDPKSIDSASVIFREGKTEKLVQIYLEETAPDSALFHGLYSVRWENVQNLAPEFYLVPSEILGPNSEPKKLQQLIVSKKISRKPFIFRRIGKQQFVEIYDTADQARLAYKAFAAERSALALSNSKAADSTVDADRLAETAERRRASAKLLQERIRMEQIETQKRAARTLDFSRLNESVRASRKDEAAKMAADAFQDYRTGSFSSAETKFAKAMELDPTSTDFYFQYGVNLYKLNEANRAIVYLNLSENKPSYAAERSYYLGLSYLKIEDFPGALVHFANASKLKHADISPSSEFYRGMILIDQKRFDDASAAFQAVLDTSKDPKLDEQAEQMMDQIIRLRQIEAEKKKKWSATTLLGEMYDSNVLLINDTSTSGGATDLLGYRTIVAGGLKYRPVYDEKKEWAFTFDALHIYTLDSDFKQRSTLRAADPTMLTVAAPYTIKSVVWGKGNKFDIKPGVESLMSSQEDDAQKFILYSGFVDFDELMILNDRWIATGKFQFRYDDSQLNSSVGDNDATAMKAKLTGGGIYFLTPDRAKMMTGDFAYTLNDAEGANLTYHRYDLSIGYITSWLWDVTVSTKLAYYYLTYPDKVNTSSPGIPDVRIDNDFGLTLSGSRKINAVLTGGLTANYTRNTSNNALYDYSKYTVLASLSANWDF